MEETEELDPSGNDVLHRIPGCNDRDRPSVTGWQRFDKCYNNRAHPPRGVALQNVLNNGEEANSPGEIWQQRRRCTTVPRCFEFKWFQARRECDLAGKKMWDKFVSFDFIEKKEDWTIAPFSFCIQLYLNCT